MAHFTTSQAEASSITRAEKVYENGSFIHWRFDIIRDDGRVLDIVIGKQQLAENESTSNIKTGVISHLTDRTDYYVEPVISSSINTVVEGSLS